MSAASRKGASFERAIADYLARELDDDRIDRRVTTGSKDRGDIGGVRIHGQRLVIECKNVTRTALAQWVAEAETERGNDDALAGVVIHKRRGTTNPGDQYVTMTLRELVALIGGVRVEEVEAP